MKLNSTKTVLLPRSVVDIHWESSQMRMGYCCECKRLLYLISYPFLSPMLDHYMSQRVKVHLRMFPECGWEKLKKS